LRSYYPARDILTDFRYEEQAKREIKDFDVIIEEELPKAVISEIIGNKDLGFESSVSYASAFKKG
jgi:hypothetical protein